MSELLIVSGVWYLMSGMTWRSEIAAFMCKHFYCAEREALAIAIVCLTPSSRYQSTLSMKALPTWTGTTSWNTRKAYDAAQ